MSRNDLIEKCFDDNNITFPMNNHNFTTNLEKFKYITRRYPGITLLFICILRNESTQFISIKDSNVKIHRNFSTFTKN